MSAVRVSILTNSYNSGDFIERTIESVKAQDYEAFEYIVLDSGSTDGTADVLARHPWIDLVADAPATIVDKINLGLERARGDIIGWISADDVYLPGAISKAVRALDEHPEALAVYCNFLEIDADDRDVRREKSRQATTDDLLNVKNFVPHQTTFFRRDAALAVGGVRHGIDRVMDWDLWIRLSRRGPLLYVDDYWAAFRVHAAQGSQVKRFDFWPEGRRMTREHGAKLVSPLVLTHYRDRAAGALRMLAHGDFTRFGCTARGHLTAMWRGSGLSRAVARRRPPRS
jgi:glycosyltransferase involved in cell wall biosynthesis